MSPEDDRPNLTPINLHILHNLWLPDVEILDLKAFETHSVLSKLEGQLESFIYYLSFSELILGIWIDSNQEVMYALATRITFICPMRFNAFPMDIQVQIKCIVSQIKIKNVNIFQICKFKVGSFNYPMNKITFDAEVK